MVIVVPEFTIPIYALIVIGSILAGVVSACVLMHRAGAKRETIFYSSLLTFVCIFICSTALSVILAGDIRKISFVAAGGAIGVLVGIVLSVLITRDHVNECIRAWILSAPLMYGLAKLGCHFAGCCYGMPYDGLLCVKYTAKGSDTIFPVQLTEVIAFVVIYLIGLALLKKENKNATRIILALSAVAKIGLDFLRFSHVGIAVSSNQIMIAVIAIVAIVITYVFEKHLPA